MTSKSSTIGICLCLYLLSTLFTPLSATAKDKQNSALYFVDNVGQLKDQYGIERPDIDLRMSEGDLNIFIGGGAIHYQWTRTLGSVQKPKSFLEHDEAAPPREDVKVAYCRMDMELISANKGATLIKDDLYSYYENYFLKDGAEVTAHTYQKVTYKNIYPNIDWVLYTKDGKLKYDFVVHPGGNPKDIKIKYNGATDIQSLEGNIILTTPMGAITEMAPYSYYQQTKEAIPSKFVRIENVISFDIKPQSKTIVIDPVLEWATYYGGSSSDMIIASASDLAGNIYIVGTTGSTNNIATSGAYVDTLSYVSANSGDEDGFIAKFDISGVRLWGTYFPSYISDISCSKDGYIYITGTLGAGYSSHVTTGAHQTTFGGWHGAAGAGDGDAFLAKFTSTGQKVWLTYYGGNYNDKGWAVKVDNNNDVYLAGATSSSNNIASTNAYLTNYTLQRQSSFFVTGDNGFIAKFNDSGIRQWSTYYPGVIADIGIDANNNIYACGVTFTDTGIATTGSYQVLHNGIYNNNWIEGFLVKFNANGARQWGTYYGGPDFDYCTDLDCDSYGNIYMTGITRSKQGIATSNSYQPVFLGGVNDNFLVKFSATGNRIWGSYIGTSSNEGYGSSIIVTPYDQLFFAGITLGSLSLPSGAYQASSAGGLDNYLIEFDTLGVLQYGTYYGGPDYEYSTNRFNGSQTVPTSTTKILSFNYTGRVHLTGATRSNSGIATSGAHQTTFINLNSSSYDDRDGYLATFIIDTIVYFIHPFTDTSLCAGDTVKIPYKTTYSFNSGNTFTVQLSNATGSFASPTTIGTRTDTTGDTIICVIPTNIVTGNEYRIRIVASSPSRTSLDNYIDISIYNPVPITATNNGPLCEGDTLMLFATPAQTQSGVTYSWTGPNNDTVQNPIITNAVVSDSGVYIVSAKFGACITKDTTLAAVNIIPSIPIASSNNPVCPGTDMNLAATSAATGVIYNWTGPGSYNSNQQNPTRTNTIAAWAGDYTVTATRNGCTSAPDTTTVAVYITTPTPNAANNGPLCSGQNLNLSASTIPGATYNWAGPNFNANTQNPTRTAINFNGAGDYYVTATINGCVSLTDTTNVVVNVAPSISIYPSPGDSICVGQSVTCIAIESNAGSNQNYQWLHNGIRVPGATNKTYITGSTVSSGDIIQCEMIATGQCSTPFTDTSNAVTIIVKPIQTPKVTITANPGTLLSPWQLVTFTANYVYGGNNPQFQWMRNGSPVIGATSSIWGTYNLNNNDTIWVEMTSNDPCTSPKEVVSNKLAINLMLGIDEMVTKDNIILYPNPNKGTFTIVGNTPNDEEVTIDILNALGQIVYKTSANIIDQKLHYTANIRELATGVYIARIHNDFFSHTIRFTVH